MIEDIITDTALVLCMRWLLAVIFVIGSAHKLKSPDAFAATLRGYRLLPALLITPAAYLILTAELIAASTLLMNTRLGSLIALVLLFMYIVAISINLVRGRRDIDCGCVGPALRQTLSGWLVSRNIGFVALALLTMLPENSPRALEILDWFTALAAALTFSLILFAATQLSSTATRFRRQSGI